MNANRLKLHHFCFSNRDFFTTPGYPMTGEISLNGELGLVKLLRCAPMQYHGSDTLDTKPIHSYIFGGLENCVL